MKEGEQKDARPQFPVPKGCTVERKETGLEAKIAEATSKKETALEEQWKYVNKGAFKQ